MTGLKSRDANRTYLCVCIDRGKVKEEDTKCNGLGK